MGKAAKSDAKLSPSFSKDDAYLTAVIPRRIALFESIKAEQIKHLESIRGEDIKYNLILSFYIYLCLFAFKYNYSMCCSIAHAFCMFVLKYALYVFDCLIDGESII